ncbi:hypothetical protein SAMN05216377_108180 [Pseudonocardia oroxyli]|uniref:Uncharacterized protein n=1 Tax=Pseudonocardia oroxyli TaxID=366584 RepID=A0A1G7QTN5_PSEOR|nr:hypothetical protein SAMN05216377_108180 [Pseudonocardia oroxyli]
MKLFTTTRTTGDVCGVPTPSAARVMKPESARLRGGWAQRAYVQGNRIPLTDHNWTGVSVPGGLSRS